MDSDDIDDCVLAEELGVDASEEEMGVVHVQAIRFRRSTVVIVEDSEGVVGIGMSNTWPWQRLNEAVRQAYARQAALRQLRTAQAVAREKRALYAERQAALSRAGVPLLKAAAE